MQDAFPINVVLDDIRSALNVGAIFRTCEATNIDTLYLTGITPYPPHNKIPKTALGAVANVNWIHNKNRLQVLNKLKKKNNRIISVEITNNSKDLYQFDFQSPSALVFGHEVNGVDNKILEISNDIVHIPMFGKKESLNVATSCGIVLYEIIRQLKYS
ncbi:TrmH family RNA methyltransferase [Candidatus Dojkabacteria bacterium]|nr:TrmH family RNA methyltransferase [Candidatus Dojkabacteria bacterium]